MHEMGLADDVLKTVDRVAKEEGGTVQSVTVELGDLSGVVPHFLEDAWRAVRDNTPYADVELYLHRVGATAKCAACGKVFVVDVDDLRCPDSKSDMLLHLSGQDMTITEIEIYDPALAAEVRRTCGAAMSLAVFKWGPPQRR